MKRANLLVGVSFFAVLVLSPFLVSGQTVSDPKLPDYTSWEKIHSGTAPVLLDGKDTELMGEEYRYTDRPNLKRFLLELVYREDGSPWFALQQEVIGESQPDGRVTIKETRVYMFENVNGKWVFVRDLSRAKEPGEFINFLKERYKLEFK